MTDTYGGRTKSRSSKLKKIDRMLKQYESTRTWNSFQELDNALSEWLITFDIKSWENSIRNKRLAVTKLKNAIDFVSQFPAEIVDDPYVLHMSDGIWVDDPDFDKKWQAQQAEREALAFVQQHREESWQLLFRDARIHFRSRHKDIAASDLHSDATWIGINNKLRSGGINVTTAKGMSENWNDNTSQAGKHWAAAGGQWNRLGTQVFGAAEWPQVLAALGENTLFTQLSNTFSSLYAAMIPFIGVAKSGFDAIKGFAMAAYKQYELTDQRRHAAAVLGERNPQAAFAAMDRLIRHEVNDNLVQGARGITALGSKVVCMFVDGGMASGPAIGIAEGIAKIMQKLYILKRSYDYMNAGNICLDSYRHGHPVSLEIFSESPILGCYFLCNANTSDLLNWLKVEYGGLEWQTEVEALIKTDVKPIILRANSAIQDSQIKVTGVASNKGSFMYQGMDRFFDGVNKTLAYTSKGGLGSLAIRTAYSHVSGNHAAKEAAREERKKKAEEIRQRLKSRIQQNPKYVGGFGNTE